MDLEEDARIQVRLWLGATLVMVFCMVFIGGITRLTDSGLSMVEWRPLLGAIPPLNQEQWSEVFEKYKAYPEYKIVNSRMSLEEFKFIFFWEYFHRLFGRLIGLVFIVPYFYFLFRKKLNAAWAKRLGVALLLGGSQGLLGWFMVKSGLVDRPDVSHFRLAAHFGLALLIAGYLFWLMLKLSPNPAVGEDEVPTGSGKLLAGFGATLILQVVFGAFVAGLDAGIGYNTFPKMGKYWMPKILTSGESFWMMMFESNVGVQFVHRCLGWILFGFAAALIWFATKKISNRILKRDFLLAAGMVIAQFLLGVSTLLSKVQMELASAHQMGACLLTLIAIKCVYDVTHVNKVEAISVKSANKTTA